jgi:hypothetical protein
MSDPSDKLPHCPKCRSGTFIATVSEEETRSCDFVNGQPATPYMDISIPVRLAAYGDCKKCGHHWRFRDKWAV